MSELTPSQRTLIASLTIHQVSVDRGVSAEDIRGLSRSAKIAEARHICFWLLQQRFGITCVDAAALMNRINHGTALHSRHLIDSLAAMDADLDAYLTRLHVSVLAQFKRANPHDDILTACHVRMDPLAVTLSKIEDSKRLLRLRDLINALLTA